MKRDRIILFLNSIKERDLMHPSWSMFLFWCINFAAKVFCECTFLEKKFSLNTPILKKNFLWIHPFWRKFSLDTPTLKKSFLWIHPLWRKVFSGYTHFKIFFLEAPILSVHGRTENSPPKSSNKKKKKKKKKKNTFFSCSAIKTEQSEKPQHYYCAAFFGKSYWDILVLSINSS